MRVALVPGVPALLPTYASASDPVPELRKACTAAVDWLLPDRPGSVTVPHPSGSLASRVGAHLLDGRGAPAVGTARTVGDPVLLVANGSACRGERAPGHLDERARPFDDALGTALRTGDLQWLRGLDVELAQDVLASGLGELRELAAVLQTWETDQVLYDDDPYGVQYWVVTAECAS